MTDLKTYGCALVEISTGRVVMQEVEPKAFDRTHWRAEALCSKADAMAQIVELKAALARFTPTMDGPLDLTRREQETLIWLSKGHTTRETASGLGLSPATVNDYIKTLYRKLGVSSRAEMALIAVRMGLI